MFPSSTLFSFFMGSPLYSNQTVGERVSKKNKGLLGNLGMLGWAEVALDHCELSSSWASPFLGWQSHSAIKRSISVCWAIERFRVGAEGSTLSPGVGTSG